MFDQVAWDFVSNGIYLRRRPPLKKKELLEIANQKKFCRHLYIYIMDVERNSLKITGYNTLYTASFLHVRGNNLNCILLKMGCYRTPVWGVWMAPPVLLLIGCSVSHPFQVLQYTPRTPLLMHVNHSNECYGTPPFYHLEHPKSVVQHSLYTPQYTSASVMQHSHYVYRAPLGSLIYYTPKVSSCSLYSMKCTHYM